MTDLGLYIHIPFCASRCIYCGFYSTTQPSLQDLYVEALCREIDLRQSLSDGGRHISTVYLGGGTPSQLTRQNLERLFTYIYKVYDVAPDAEITMECNPDDVTPELIKGLPVNRVSMGVQTFSDERLRFLRRRHDASEAIRGVQTLRSCGINNISIDLMFGFPDETLDEWRADIDKAISLKPEHISAYSLMYEEGTRLGQMLERGEVKEIDEELSLQMYDMLIDTLCANGYEHYEISNFALTGGNGASWRSRHNSSYWHDKPYIGLGASAHSYDIKSRSWNIDNIREYINAITKGVLPSESEAIDANTHYDDIVTTALRTCEGIDMRMLEPRFRTYLMREAQKHIDRGLLATDGKHISLTRKGLFVSDMVMSDLMYGE